MLSKRRGKWRTGQYGTAIVCAQKNINRYLFLLSTTDFYDFYADDK